MLSANSPSPAVPPRCEPRRWRRRLTLDRPRRRRKPASSRLVRRRRCPAAAAALRPGRLARGVGVVAARARVLVLRRASLRDRRRLRLRREKRPDSAPLGSHKPPSSEMSGRPTKASPPGPPDSRSSRNWSSPRLPLPPLPASCSSVNGPTALLSWLPAMLFTLWMETSHCWHRYA